MTAIIDKCVREAVAAEREAAVKRVQSLFEFDSGSVSYPGILKVVLKAIREEPADTGVERGR